MILVVAVQHRVRRSGRRYDSRLQKVNVRHTNSPCSHTIAWVVAVMLCLPIAVSQLTAQGARARQPDSSQVLAAHAGAVRQAESCRGPTGVCELVARFLNAFNARDFDAFRSTFADDITFFVDRPFPPQRLDGRLAAEGVFEAGFAASHPPAGGVVQPLPPPLVPIDLEVQAFGDVAVVSFVLRRPTEVARRTLVLHQSSVGWRVVHIHASSSDVARE